MKIKFTIDTSQVSPLPFLDLDIDVSRVYYPRDVEGMKAVKCDGEYFLIPEGENDLAVIVEDKNQVPESQVLGLQGMMEKYIAPHFEIKAG